MLNEREQNTLKMLQACVNGMKLSIELTLGVKDDGFITVTKNERVLVTDCHIKSMAEFIWSDTFSPYRIARSILAAAAQVEIHERVKEIESNEMISDIKWIKFDMNKPPKRGPIYLKTDGVRIELCHLPSDEWGLFYGGIRKVSDVTHYAIITPPSSDINYLIIEPLMGGIGWIHYHYRNEDYARSKYKELSENSPANKFQLSAMTNQELANELYVETLKYSRGAVKDV